jgi:hypothetical protein
MIAVLDANIMVAASLSPFGASFRLLSMVPQRRFEFLLSVPLMFEYEDALKRDDIRFKSIVCRRDCRESIGLADRGLFSRARSASGRGHVCRGSGED